MYGYVGKLLFVDLSSGSIEVRDLPERYARNFIGGAALGARILYDEMPPKTDVFGPDSMVGFVGGPLNNTPSFFGGRYTVVSKSPVYGGFNDCNSGGFFAPMLKRSGYDGIFIKGIAEKPVYILVDNGEVQILDASHLWGKTIRETEAELAKIYEGKKFQAAIIGPSGEKLSHIAAIMNDSHRAAARGGSGAVVGSKKLKALVVMGNHKVELYDRDAVIAANKLAIDAAKNGPMKPVFAALQNVGTTMSYIPCSQTGDAGVRNWSGCSAEHYPESAAISANPAVDDREYKIKKYACASCPLGCGAIYEIKDGKWPMQHTSRPEYETLAAFGSNLCCSDRWAIMKCNDLCNDYGVDTISAGGTVAWAMDCYNRGILTLNELDGIDLAWGDADAIVAITEKLVSGEGCGAKLLNGSAAAVKAFGKGEECLAVASGIELGQHGILFAPGAARGYKYDPTPGRHTKITHMTMLPVHPPYKGTGFNDIVGTADSEMFNNSGICAFNPLTGFPDLTRLLINGVTGFDLSPVDMFVAGIRSLNMRAAFNLREGIKREDYTLSEKLHTAPPEMRGPLEGIKVDVELLSENAFNVLGWDQDMIPNARCLAMLGGLDQIIAEICPPPPGPPPMG